MRIELRLRESPATQLVGRVYDPDEDDIRSILMDVCRAIQQESDLLVSGFGQGRWPVDVGTDLPVLLEQLPAALRAVDEGSAFEIDFYEQGIERSIAFTLVDGRYIATCASRTNWRPNPAVEHIDRDDLAEMLLVVREEFMGVFAKVAPDLVTHTWVRRWLRCVPEY